MNEWVSILTEHKPWKHGMLQTECFDCFLGACSSLSWDFLVDLHTESLLWSCVDQATVHQVTESKDKTVVHPIYAEQSERSLKHSHWMTNNGAKKCAMLHTDPNKIFFFARSIGMQIFRNMPKISRKKKRRLVLFHIFRS